MSGPVVTQADRDAAQAYWLVCNDVPLAEHFARHRQQAEATASAANAALVGELREALEGFVTSISGRNTLEKMLTINHAELVALVAEARALLARAGGVEP